MSIIVGRGRYRIEIQLYRHWIWYRLPFIGQGHWAKGNSWNVDNWAEIKDEARASW